MTTRIQQLNGEKGNPKSFDQLEKLLDEQWYRLAYWRVAADEINYRRFFDINDLAAIRVENPRVFEAVHRLVGQLARKAAGSPACASIIPTAFATRKTISRICRTFIARIAAGNDDEASEVYVVAEKILSGDEPLPTDWAVAGTTGYDLLNIIGRVQVDGEGFAELRSFYDATTGNTQKPAQIVYESSREVLYGTMASELQMLTAALYRIAQRPSCIARFHAARLAARLARSARQHDRLSHLCPRRQLGHQRSRLPHGHDWPSAWQSAAIARCRSPCSISSRRCCCSSIRRRSPTSKPPSAAQFALKFQQVSGPVAAKGVEDTAFYRYYPLASLNEVGGELDAKPLAVDEFHRLMRHRMESWPHSMWQRRRTTRNAARISALGCTCCPKRPTNGQQAFNRWQKMNQPLIREIDGEPVPDANEEYLLYQTLVGTWPTEELNIGDRDRVPRSDSAVHGKGAPRGEDSHFVDEPIRRVRNGDPRIHLRFVRRQSGGIRRPI